MTTGSRKPGQFIKAAHHENNNDNKGGGGGGGGTLGGWGLLWRFIHFYLRKKLESKIPWKNLGYCYSSIVLKMGTTYRWICQLNMSDEVFRSKK